MSHPVRGPHTALHPNGRATLDDKRAKSIPMTSSEPIEVLALADLKAQSPLNLLAMAEELEIEIASTMRKGEMMFQILRERADEGWEVYGDGVLEVLQDGFGFLRSPEANYLPGPDDIYVSPDMIRQYSLRTGDTIDGMIKAPDDTERYFALTNATRINFEDPEKARHKIAFDNLTPLYPDERLKMETSDPATKDRSARIIDLVAPIGKGQRALIVAPPRTGKTVLLQNIAAAIEENHPECYLLVLLIDERPEEVTDMKRSVKGEVISSTFDEPASRHVAVADMVIEKAKRLVEHGRERRRAQQRQNGPPVSLGHVCRPLSPLRPRCSRLRDRSTHRSGSVRNHDRLRGRIADVPRPRPAKQL